MCTSTRNGKHQAKGEWIRKDKRLAIYLRDRFTCLYCLKDLHDANLQNITLDHVVSRSDKGNNSETNLVTACRSCNSSRQDKPLSVFCGEETIRHINRNRFRPLAKYRELAKGLLTGSVTWEHLNLDS